MDDAAYGARDRGGHWKPFRLVEYPAVFVWPLRPLAIAKWLFAYPGYVLPWNLLYAAVAVGVWLYLTPSALTLQTFAPGWIAFVLARNACLVLLFFGAFHLRLYIRRSQGSFCKYNPKWLDVGNPVFLFRDQTRDNMFWTLASGVPIWTAYEVVTLWVFANGYIPWVSWDAHPVYLVLLMLLIPLLREVHFYLVHRLLHVPVLYRMVHKLHHNNVNPGPWSGLSMHPVEHLLYFSGVLIHWVVPSHPVHALFHLVHAGLSPVPGHTGFEKVVVGKDAVDTECYAHYLHHKYFECNYADGAVPLDRWFGTFHDGSDEAHEAMRRRRAMARAAKAGL
jgi:sterol desaturase/sphingolipid hydroxylase (fatty acid hydroxylase superfamily)